MRTLKFEAPKTLVNPFGTKAVLPVSGNKKIEVSVNFGESKLEDSDENREILEMLHIPYALS